MRNQALFENLFDWAFVGLVVVFGLLVVVHLLVYTPVMVKTQSDCLRAGYPNFKVTLRLERYCSNAHSAVAAEAVEEQRP